MGHGERNCEVKLEDAKKGGLNEGQFGLWLRADSERLNTKYTGAGAKSLSISGLPKLDPRRHAGRGGVEREDREGGEQKEQINEKELTTTRGKGGMGMNKDGEQDQGWLAEREVAYDNKENEPIVTMQMMREDRGPERMAVLSTGHEHKGADRGKQVFKELDNNILPSPAVTISRTSQGGTWKRRNCTTGK